MLVGKLQTLLLLILSLSIAHAQSFSIGLSDNTVNKVSNYSFTLFTSITSLNGTATLTFPSAGYNIVTSSALTSCYDTSNSAIALNCTVTSTTTITFRVISATIFLSIDNAITNPPYVDDFTISFDYTADDSTTYATQTAVLNTLVADSLTSASLSFSPVTTNTQSNLTVTMVNTNSIPSGGSVQLSFIGYTPTYTSLTFYPLTSSAYMTSSPTITDSGNDLLLSAVFSATVPAGTTLTFMVGSIKTPPTTSTAAFSVTILTSAKNNFINKID